MIINLLVVSIVGGIFCLDRVCVQTQISRPVVAAPLIGAILGDPYTGLIAGAFIELFWIDRMPIGAYIPPNDTAASVLVTAAAIETSSNIGQMTQGLVAMSVLIFVPFAYIGQQMDRWIIRGNERLADAALKEAMNGDVGAVSRRHLWAVMKTWLLSTGMIMCAIPLGVGFMTWAYPLLPASMVRALDLVYGLLPIIGAAVALNTIHLRGAFPVFCALFLVGTFILQYFRGL